MQKAEILAPCPCGTGINYENCCQPHILGLEKPLSAEKLLRSRYTAFVAGETDYIKTTHHPDTAKDLDMQSIIEWSRNSSWLSLEIINIDESTEKDTTFIEFCAKYTQKDGTHHHNETSIFKKKDDTWFFYDVKKNKPIVKDPAPGRNDPCTCGSGKKYKKCCGNK
ncbi:MAG: YchJ family protein [Deltaproteobacteria bacterium]|nr:YchJ family protein [Deltaproteobacteria bacterium]